MVLSMIICDDSSGSIEKDKNSMNKRDFIAHKDHWSKILTVRYSNILKVNHGEISTVKGGDEYPRSNSTLVLKAKKCRR